MSLIKIGTLLLVSAVVACVLFVVVVIATPTPEPSAPFNGWQVLGTLLLIYWLGAAVAGAIVLLVNLFNSNRTEIGLFGFWPRPAKRVGNRIDPGKGDSIPAGGAGVGTSPGREEVENGLRTSDRSSSDSESIRASVFCSKCGVQNRRAQRFCTSCKSQLPA